MDGVFIINKEKGCTSHDVVFKIRKILKTKKVGHCGTLDPMATGVLPILVGKATKIEKYLVDHNKTYIAKIYLGEKTDTLDSEGKVIESLPIKEELLNPKNLENIFKNMVGRQKQIPPMYSAIKVNGKKLYEYAREGISIELEPRDIEIFSLDLININKKEKTIEFKVNCSKGTYIRSLCDEIAKRLETVGYMKELKRIIVGSFSIENSITLNDLENQNENFYKENIISIEEIFKNNDKIILPESKLIHYLNGVKLTYKLKDGLYRIYNSKNEFLGLGIIKNELLKRDLVI